MKKEKRILRIKEPTGAKVIRTLLVIYAICMLFPYTISLNGAFRAWGSFVDNIFALKNFTLENFKRIFTEFNYPVVMDNGMPGKYYFDGLLWNTLAFSIGCSLASATCPMIVGYCTARFPNAFSRFIINLVYVLMALPIVGTAAASIQLTQKLGIYNTIPGMWFLKFNFLGMYTLIYHANFKTMAKEYFEAAYMDGAGHFTIFAKIMVPLVSKTWSITFLLSFIGFWSDYGTVLYYMPDKPTLSLALLNFNQLPVSTETMQMAAALLLAIPSITLFILFRKRITGGIQTGGIKG